MSQDCTKHDDLASTRAGKFFCSCISAANFVTTVQEVRLVQNNTCSWHGAPDAPLPERAGVQHHKLEEGLLVQLVIVAQLHRNGLVGIDGWQIDVSDSAAVEAAQVALHSQASAAPHPGDSLHALHHLRLPYISTLAFGIGYCMVWRGVVSLRGRGGGRGAVGGLSCLCTMLLSMRGKLVFVGEG